MKDRIKHKKCIDVVGVDPGSSNTGICWIVLPNKPKLTIIEDPIFHFYKKMPNEEVVDFIRDLKNHNDLTLAIEMLQFANVKGNKYIFETCVWIGRFIQEAVSQEVKWVRHKRNVIKSHLTGKWRANDRDIRRALMDRFGNNLPKMNNDCRNALAVALYHYEIGG